jgi:hypothetical protein
MKHIQTFESFLLEGVSKTGDEKIIMGVLKGMRPGASDMIKPDLSNLAEHMKRWRHNFRNVTPEDAVKAVQNFIGSGEELAGNYITLPGNIDPWEGEDRWTEDSVKKWVKDQIRDGFRFYGSYNDFGEPNIVLAKNKSTVNTLDMSKPLNPDDFWNDFYANYIP